MKKFLTFLFLWPLGLISAPGKLIADMQDATSSDIMAEIEFLEGMYPERPEALRITNLQESAFLNYLSSYAICKGWEYMKYEEFVATYESELQKFVPADRTLRITLFEDSYKARVESGCEINDDAKNIVEGIFGDVATYYTRIKVQAQILEAIEKRTAEMLRRTLGQGPSR